MHRRSFCEGALSLKTKNKILSLPSIMMLWSSSLFFFSFAILVSLDDISSCDFIKVKNFHEILRYFF